MRSSRQPSSEADLALWPLRFVVTGNDLAAQAGLFPILARDDAPGIMEARQIRKTVRVVSTVEYLLVE